MKTVKEILLLATDYFKERKVAAPRLSAEELLANLLGLKRIELYMQFDRPLLEEELSLFRPMLKRRGQGEPVDYILGRVQFGSVSLKVDSNVLIPRPETEILLERICKENFETGTALDLCTGSGCLAVALKKRFSQLQVSASDLSAQALEVAKQNAEQNGVEVKFYQGDLLQPLSGLKFDLVVCNPPYISQAEFDRLDREVSGFEPKSALLAGQTGLEFFERLARDLPSHLNAGAHCFFEMGAGQGEAVKNIFNLAGWKEIHVENDWAGHTRFLNCGF